METVIHNMKKIIGTHPTEGTIYEDTDGRTFHVAPDGTRTEIHLEDTDDVPFSEIAGAIYVAPDKVGG